MWHSKTEIFCALLLSVLLVCFGCSDPKKTYQALRGKKKSDAGQISAHFKTYARLKEKDPVRARGELYVASHLLHNGHEKSDLWAELVYEMDTEGEIPLDRLLVYEKLQLELARDTGASDETIQTHQDVVASTEARVAVLIADGKDPKHVKVAGYKFDFSPDPKP